MKRLTLSIFSLLTTLSPTGAVSIAYAQSNTPAHQNIDCAGAGCMGGDSKLERSSGLSAPSCVGAGCMGN